MPVVSVDAVALGVRVCNDEATIASLGGVLRIGIRSQAFLVQWSLHKLAVWMVRPGAGYLPQHKGGDKGHHDRIRGDWQAAAHMLLDSRHCDIVALGIHVTRYKYALSHLCHLYEYTHRGLLQCASSPS